MLVEPAFCVGKTIDSELIVVLVDLPVFSRTTCCVDIITFGVCRTCCVGITTCLCVELPVVLIKFSFVFVEHVVVLQLHFVLEELSFVFVKHVVSI